MGSMSQTVIVKNEGFLNNAVPIRKCSYVDVYIVYVIYYQENLSLLY